MECRAYGICLDSQSRGYLGKDRKVSSAAGGNLSRMHKTQETAKESRLNFMYSHLRNRTLAVDRSQKQCRRSFKRVRPLARVSSPWAISLRALEERCTQEDIVFKFRSVSSKLIISPKSTPQERLDSDAVGCSPGGAKSPVEGIDAPAVTCLIYAALSEWQLGNIASSHATMAESISVANRSQNESAG